MCILELNVLDPWLHYISLIGRLNQKNLEMIDAALKSDGNRDLTAAQALILMCLKDDKVTVGSLVNRGFYSGSNVSHNLKKLVTLEYVVQQTSEDDRRVLLISSTDKGRLLGTRLRDRLGHVFSSRKELEKHSEQLAAALKDLNHLDHDQLLSELADVQR